MSQSNPSEWWEVVTGILAIPSTIIGIIGMYYVIQKHIIEKPKNKLEEEKLKLEKRMLELEILEKESKLRRKGKILDEPPKDIKLKSALEKILVDIQAVEQNISNFLLRLLSRFIILEEQKSTVSINNQRVIGSLIELFFLMLFLYANAVQIANTFPYLFPTPVPPFLTNLVLPLVISTAGTSLVLGLIMGDLLGMTNLTSWAELQERRKIFLPIILLTLILSIVFSSLLSLSRLDLLQNNSPIILVITSLVDGLFIIPSLITSSFLFNGIQGISVLLALPIFLLRFPVTVLRKVITRTIYYVSDS